MTGLSPSPSFFFTSKWPPFILRLPLQCFQVGENLDICFRSLGHGTGRRPAEMHDHRTARTAVARPQKADRPFMSDMKLKRHCLSPWRRQKLFIDCDANSQIQTQSQCSAPQIVSYTGKHTHRRNISQFTHPDTLILLTTCKQINVNSSVNKHFIFAKKK